MSNNVLNNDLPGRFLELAQALNKSVNAMGGERYRLATKGTVPGVDLLQEIKEAFPQVDMNWLVTGKGDMFIKEVAPAPVVDAEARAYSAIKAQSRLLTDIMEQIEGLATLVDERLPARPAL